MDKDKAKIKMDAAKRLTGVLSDSKVSDERSDDELKGLSTKAEGSMYLISKRFRDHGCIAIKAEPGEELAALVASLSMETSKYGVQVFTVSSREAYGEYEPYEILGSVDEFIKRTHEMANDPMAVKRYQELNRLHELFQTEENRIMLLPDDKALEEIEYWKSLLGHRQ